MPKAWFLGCGAGRAKLFTMKRVVFTLLLVVSLTGCTMLGLRSNTDRYVAIHYYPYTVSTVRTIAKPMPEYENWNDMRMRLDLERLANLKVDIVMVTVEPKDIQTPARALKYLRFVDLAAKYPFDVAFMADGQRASLFDIRKFCEWCEQNLPNRLGYFHYQGQPLIEFHNALNAVNYTSPSLTIRRTDGGSEWAWGPGKNGRPEVSPNGEQVMVFAGLLLNGDRPELGFSLKREKGSCVRRQFRQAAAMNARFICIASYNDFYEGSFVEPNTFDGDSAFKALRSEIAWFK
jgi:hypothetical protein